MLRLFLQIKDQKLKVRQALSHENFSRPLHWKGVDFQFQHEQDFMMAWTSLLPELRPEDARALIELQADRYPVSIHYHNLKKICPELVFSQSADEWVFFGGSFNPWHDGHQSLLNLLPQEKVCFLLPDNNPLKPLRDFDLNVTVLELSSRIKFGNNQFLVPTFLIENKKNPTIVWIERLKNDFPEKRLSLLLGFDSFKNLKQWTRYTDLLTILDTLYVASRLENDSERKIVAEEMMKINPSIKIDFLGRHSFENLSSTNLRNKK